MKKGNNKGLKYLLFLLVVIIVCYVAYELLIQYLGEPSSYLNNEIISYDTGESYFDPQTILEDIKSDKSDIFFESVSDVESTPQDYNIYNNKFSDEELYVIARNYFQSKWDEESDNWKLISVFYHVDDCIEGFNGPYTIEYSFGKKNSVEVEKTISERRIKISLWERKVIWIETVENKSGIILGNNWESMNYYGMDVYRLAENSIDLEVNDEVKKTCEFITIYTYGLDNNWYIDYNDYLGFDLLELKVNQETGKVKK